MFIDDANVLFYIVHWYFSLVKGVFYYNNITRLIRTPYSMVSLVSGLTDLTVIDIVPPLERAARDFKLMVSLFSPLSRLVVETEPCSTLAMY